MAIAPLPDLEAAEWVGDPLCTPWPRPQLQVVPVPDGSAIPLTRAVPWVAGRLVVPVVGVGVDVAERRTRRALVRRRRRCALLVAVTAVLGAGLALPLSALGGAPAAAAHGPAGPSGLSGGTVYEVRPGDTLWSIAERFDQGGDPRPLAEALARETGSSVVVPGEHLTIP